MPRDRDVRRAIQTALQGTGVFDAVLLTGLPEVYGGKASDAAVATIEPSASQQSDHWDGGAQTGLVITSRVTITFLARAEDPQVRDEAAEQLLQTAMDTIQGSSLANLTLPDKTRFTAWVWQTASPPERRIMSTCVYDYIVEGWAGYDEIP